MQAFRPRRGDRDIGLRITVLILLFAIAFLGAAAEEKRCKKCGAPLEPGARFCTHCGARVEDGEAPEAAAAPAPSADPQASVVQLVATHDRELTSAYGSIELGASLKIDSILGSAFAIAPGEFLTDAGLVEGAKEIHLRTPGGKNVPATVKGIDPMIGVALLSADLPELPPLPPRPGGPPGTGEGLTALGFPSGRTTGGTVATTNGVTSGVRRTEMGIHPVEDLIQTDASLARGFAGGPVVDTAGRYVGMSTALTVGKRTILGPETGLALAIPVAWIDRSLAWIRAGTPPRVWIGALTELLDDDKRKSRKLPPEAQRLVAAVYPGSPAEAAGLKKDDVILSAEGTPVKFLLPVQEKLLEAEPGSSLGLEILRDGKKVPVSVTLAPRPERPRLRAEDALRVYGGFELEPQGDNRLVVSKVLPSTQASQADLKSGDVLKSLLTKKDLDRTDKNNARWRGVNNLDDLERLVTMGYSDFDFYLGLRFQAKDGKKRSLYLLELLTPTSAL